MASDSDILRRILKDMNENFNGQDQTLLTKLYAIDIWKLLQLQKLVKWFVLEVKAAEGLDFLSVRKC